MDHTVTVQYCTEKNSEKSKTQGHNHKAWKVVSTLPSCVAKGGKEIMQGGKRVMDSSPKEVLNLTQGTKLPLLPPKPTKQQNIRALAPLVNLLGTSQEMVGRLHREQARLGLWPLVNLPGTSLNHEPTCPWEATHSQIRNCATKRRERSPTWPQKKSRRERT